MEFLAIQVILDNQDNQVNLELAANLEFLVNLANQDSLDNQDILDTQVNLVFLANLATRVILVTQANLELVANQANLEFLANQANLDAVAILAIQVLVASLDYLGFLAFPVSQDILGPLVPWAPRALKDSLEPVEHPDILATQDYLELVASPVLLD